MPCSLSAASSLSCSIVDCSDAGAGAGGAAACGGGACCASCAPQRSAWRRDTRLLTAVAVPATTAVRATPLSSPGIDRSSRSWSGRRLGGVERGKHVLDRYASAGDQLAARAANGGRERRRPAVLIDE